MIHIDLGSNVRRRLMIWSMFVMVVLAGVVFAGSLTPPPGPVSPTMKTLDQVEPSRPVEMLAGSGAAVYVISQPGAYHLTQNLEAPVGKDGIQINSSNVRLDLRGFRIRTVDNTKFAVRSDGPIDGVRVENGSVMGSDIGIYLLGRSHTADKISAMECRVGIAIDYSSIVSNSVARGCGEGFALGKASLAFNCTASNCDTGFIAGFQSTVRNSVAGACTFGFSGFEGSTIRDNQIGECIFGIFTTQDRVTITNNTIDNSVTGIRIEGNQCVIGENNVFIGTNGVSVAAGKIRNYIYSNRVTGATTPFTIPANNSFGPLVNITSVGAITGVANANHPQANFIY
ncbi:MAG TPA: hypothetical protein PLO61_06345 [Fimbriimonadaceae bacterium]|nr:hypothetical protein [Fimbriimonadaceae bacterium]